jgi:hypothetical protein
VLLLLLPLSPMVQMVLLEWLLLLSLKSLLPWLLAQLLHVLPWLQCSLGGVRILQKPVFALPAAVLKAVPVEQDVFAAVLAQAWAAVAAELAGPQLLLQLCLASPLLLPVLIQVLALACKLGLQVAEAGLLAVGLLLQQLLLVTPVSHPQERLLHAVGACGGVEGPWRGWHLLSHWCLAALQLAVLPPGVLGAGQGSCQHQVEPLHGPQPPLV